MSEYSPAPWTIGKSWSDDESMTIYDAQDVPVIPDVIGVYENHPVDIRLADLQLMAAAPELLEALEDLITYSDHYDGEQHADSGLGAYMKARAAIDKAKGKS